MRRPVRSPTPPHAGLRLALAWSGVCAGCGGSAPLLHPAHVLLPGRASVGAGLSGEMIVAGAAAGAGAPADGAAPVDDRRRALQELTVAPAIAPWVGARFGVAGANEAGLTYSGRALRVDGRHAFGLGGGPAAGDASASGDATLSVGLGAAALLAERPGEDAVGAGAYGGGVDVPVLLGFQSTAGLYSLWLGPRFGLELVRGRVAVPSGAAGGPIAADASGQHLQLGFVLGVQAGFRHLHVALEVDAAYHRAWGELGGERVLIEQATVAPGGGMIVAF